MEIALVCGIKLPSPFYLWTAPAWLAWYLFARATTGKSHVAEPSIHPAHPA
jgi:hypothetical protein